MKRKKNYSKKLKSKAALATIKGNQTVNEIASKFGIHTKQNTSKANPQNKVYPYFLNNFDVTRSNQVWCTDITYSALSGGFVYLTAGIDWHKGADEVK